MSKHTTIAMPSVLITGASGFLGQECCTHFEAAGFRVITTDTHGIVALTGDLRDAAFTSGLPAVDVVVHCAAATYIRQVPLFFRESHFISSNVTATRRLMDRYRSTDTHVINVGTSMMYEQTGRIPYDVGSPLKGAGVYSRSKLLAQRYIDSCPHTATVIPCIIGGRGREGLFRALVHTIAQWGFAVCPTTRSHPIQMVHVSDVASLILRIATKRELGWYNAAGRHPLSIVQWIDAISTVVRRQRVRLVAVAPSLLSTCSALTGYRLLAQEQLEMLSTPHVLSIERSEGIGWNPQYDNSDIIQQITCGLLGDSALPSQRIQQEFR